MRKVICLILLSVGIVLHAQTSTVTATVTDSDNQTWNNGTFQVTFVPPTGYQGTIYTFNGVGWTPTVHQGTLSSTGVLTLSGLERNDYIVPTGSKWKFTICPNASFRCSDTTLTINQVSQTITSSLTLTVPRFPASNTTKGSYGYADVEISPVPPVGNQYFNVNLNAIRVWDGTQWNTGGGGTSGSGNIAGDVSGVASATTVDRIRGGTIPVSKPIVGTNASGQLIDASTVTLPNSITGNAATATNATHATNADHAVIADTATSAANAAPGGTNLQLQYNNANTLGGATGVSVDAATKSSLYLNSAIPAAQPMFDIRHPSFAGGAVCNGVADATPALQAAINALPIYGGGIFIPDGCLFTTNNTLTFASGGKAISLFINGTATMRTTFRIDPHGYVNIYGQGGGNSVTFQGPGRWARIVVAPASGSGTGTLGASFNVTSGTITSGTNTLTVVDPTSYNIGDTIVLSAAGVNGYTLSTTITGIAGNVFTLANSASNTMNNSNGGAIIGRTITFTPSSMSGLMSNAAIVVVDTQTCTLTGNPVRNTNRVTATYSGICNIPPGTVVTVAGCDSGFNGTSGNSGYPQQFDVIDNDRGLKRLTWWHNGANATSTLAGTVTGMDSQSVDHVKIISTTSTTATATFWRTHASNAGWGLVNTFVDNGDGSASPHILFQDMVLLSYAGTALWLQTYGSTMNNVGFQGCGAGFPPFTATGLEYESSFVTMSRSSVASCGGPWGIRMSNPYNAPNGISGPLYVDHSFIMGGIHMDHGASNLTCDTCVFDQVTVGGVQVDPTNYWASSRGSINLTNSGYNDNPNQYLNSFVYYETPPPSAVTRGNLVITNPAADSALAVNDYFTGTLLQNGGAGQFSINVPRGVVGTYNDGDRTDGESRGSGANLSPAVIPYPTIAVSTNPASWPTTTCNIATNGLAPDGTLTAGILTKASGQGNSMVYNTSQTFAVGDTILYGGWLYSSTASKTDNTQGNGGIWLDNGNQLGFKFVANSSDTTNITGSNDADSMIVGDWWHPIVARSTIGVAGTASLRMYLGCNSDRTMNFWMPFIMIVPASANVPLAELNRWKAQLLHGFVPPSASVGQAYSNNPIVLPADPTTGLQAATKNYVDSHVAGGGGTQVLEFTTTTFPAGIGCTGTNPYTCTSFPISTHQLQLLVISGAGGGGSGATCTNASNCFGGGGGTSGGMVTKALPATFFGTAGTATIVVTVGTGGAGGAAQAGTSASGNVGGGGTVSKICGSGFPCISAFPNRANVSAGGAGGAGGTATTGTGGTVGTGGWTTQYTCPGQAGASGSPGNYAVCDFPNFGSWGGSGGAGLVSSVTAAGGSQVGSLPLFTGIAIAGAVGGSAGGGNGTMPTFTGFTGFQYPYQTLGGTGGGSGCTVNGGTGGNGMTPGGGGGGGGAACNTFSSGAGGNGGDGFVRIVVM